MKPNLFYLLVLICPIICNAQNPTSNPGPFVFNVNQLHVELVESSSLNKIYSLINLLDTITEPSTKYGSYTKLKIHTVDTFNVNSKNDTNFFTLIDSIYESGGTRWEES